MWAVSLWEAVYASGLCLTDSLQSFLKQDELLPQQAAKTAGFPSDIDYSL